MSNSTILETDDITAIGEHSLQVSFNPPLFLQRQAWVLDILRHESVQSVLDIGCGEGSLLQCLTQPAWSLPPPFHANLSHHERDIYIHTLHGLDPSPTCMIHVSDAVTPEEIKHGHGTLSSSGEDEFKKYTSWGKRQPRWMDTKVSLWEGGFELLNEEIFGHGKVEAFVATEVIEHLSTELLPLFAPILLGRYRPRLLLLTTPNYTYNQRFVPPGEVSRTGFLDPTSRTNRVFRHNDHKFEWTQEEWTTYCATVAQEFGYSVEMDGFGQAVEPDPWHREGSLGFATQAAVFRRLDDQLLRNTILNLPEPTRKPVLRAHYHYKTYPLSDSELAQPVNLEEIRNIVEEEMRVNQTGTMTLHELWNEGQVSVLCKGDVGALMHALGHGTEREAWLFGRIEDGWSMEVIWKEFVPNIPETNDPEQSEFESLYVTDDECTANSLDGDEGGPLGDRADADESNSWNSITMESSWGPPESSWDEDEVDLSCISLKTLGNSEELVELAEQWR